MAVNDLYRMFLGMFPASLLSSERMVFWSLEGFQPRTSQEMVTQTLLAQAKSLALPHESWLVTRSRVLTLCNWSPEKGSLT